MAVGDGGKVIAVGVGGNVTAVGVGGRVIAVGVGTGLTGATLVVGLMAGLPAGSEDVHATIRKRAVEITAIVDIPGIELVMRMKLWKMVQKCSRIICDLTQFPFLFDAGLHKPGCGRAYNPPVIQHVTDSKFL